MNEAQRKRLPPFLLWSYLVLSVVWLVCHLVVILRFRMLDSDSMMYGLPLVFSQHPFDLKIPWIGDLKSYDDVWGHHWPGGMWVRAAIYSVVPFSRIFDISLLLLSVWGAATLTGRIIWKITGWWWLAGAGALLVMSDRLVIANIQLHRFEGLAILAFTALLATALETGKTFQKRWLIIGLVSAFLLPTLHPYGVPLGGILTIFFLWRAFISKTGSQILALVIAVAAASGVTALGLWFYLQPGAWEQFSANVALQKTFNRQDYAALWVGLSGYRFGSGRILWAGALFASGLILFGFTKKLETPYAAATLRWLPATLFLGHAAFHIITKSANYAYLCFGFPLAAILLAQVLKECSRREWPLILKAASGFTLAVIMLFGTLLPYRMLQFMKAGTPNFSEIASEVLADIPAGRTVCIPPPLWYAASQRPDLNIRLWTFSVASAKELRLEYEQTLYSQLKPGDLMVADDLAGRTGDTYGILPTFDYRNLDPKFWREVKRVKQLYPGMDMDFGYDFVIYEFLGGDWVSTL